ncbi:hypothetical protein ALC57_17115 [Trachymyrmex cornetzi]|uniref:EF-hand domain-containing protein n=1 Tax=Trachymyrmex cornetzi TaxID=471704 RepID=A0A195DC72_9HYME|nr:hypothetical protein ALC57_17115 [Trachymyrmex cornetzi]
MSYDFSSGDGNVSFEEFVEIVSNIGGASTAAPTDQHQEEQELRDAFRVTKRSGIKRRAYFLSGSRQFSAGLPVFDKHNRGYITASDLRAVLQCLGEDLSEEEKFVHALGEPGIDEDEEDDDEDLQSPLF